MFKVYHIKNNITDWTCTVELNEEFLISHMSKPDQPYTTLDAMKSMILFWTGGERRIAQSDGDIVIPFLQQLSREVMIICAERNYSLKGLLSEFNNREGWCDMDGSWGIKIIGFDTVDIDYDDFDVEEQTLKTSDHGQN